MAPEGVGGGEGAGFGRPTLSAAQDVLPERPEAGPQQGLCGGGN